MVNKINQNLDKRGLFYLVDVFAEDKFSGNQLAVFVDGQKFSDSEMQQLAREMNYSETTFILSEERSGFEYNIRIFTPRKEIAFAGHPVLGTAFVIQKELIKKQIENLILNLKAGRIPVDFYYSEEGEVDYLVMEQKEPIFGKTFSPQEISAVLKVETSDIDSEFPIREVSTGLPFIIVPLRTLDAVRRVKINHSKYLQLIENTEAKAILAFCPQTYRKENHLNVRVFADYYGIPEDAATGSGNGCLAGYLVKHRYFDSNQIDLRVEQGYEIERPSLLFLKAKKEGEKIEVWVGERVVMVARGELV